MFVYVTTALFLFMSCLPYLITGYQSLCVFITHTCLSSCVSCLGCEAQCLLPVICQDIISAFCFLVFALIVFSSVFQFLYFLFYTVCQSPDYCLFVTTCLPLNINLSACIIQYVIDPPNCNCICLYFLDMTGPNRVNKKQNNL